MNRRSFLKLLPLLPVAAKAIALAAEAPVDDALAIRVLGQYVTKPSGNCMAMSTGKVYTAHPNQIAAFQRALGLEITRINNCRSKLLDMLRESPTFQSLDPLDSGHWRAACPT